MKVLPQHKKAAASKYKKIVPFISALSTIPHSSFLIPDFHNPNNNNKM